MNRFERMADGLDPRLSVRLRSLKKRLQHRLDFALLADFATAGDTVIDAGANRGVYAFRLAQLVGASGRVFAAEPLPKNIRLLRSIFANKRNVTLWPVALSDASGTAEFHVPLFEGAEIDALGSLHKPRVASSTITVGLDRLDSLVPPGADVSFMKCDVEGNELAVIRGAQQLLRRSHPVLLIEIEQRHHQDDIHHVFAHLTREGYAGHFIEGTSLQPISAFDIERHQLRFLDKDFVPYDMPNDYVSDFVFVHPERWPTSVWPAARVA